MRFIRSSIAGFILALSACANPPQAFRDYCETQGRQLTPRERYEAALLYVYDDVEQRHLRHFAAFRSRYLSADHNAAPRDVVSAYIARYPDCCALLSPWTIREYDRQAGLLGSNPQLESAHIDITERDAERGFRWVSDVFITQSRYPLDVTHPSDHVELRASDCGQISRPGRG